MRPLLKFLIIIILVTTVNLKGYADGLLSARDITQRPLFLLAQKINTWEKGGIRVFVAHSDVKVIQGNVQIVADEAICWFHEKDALQALEATVEVYCEGDVTIFQGENYESYEQVYLRFETMTGIAVDAVAQPIQAFEEPRETDVFVRGEKIRALRRDEYLSFTIPTEDLIPGVPSEREVIDVIADTIDSWEEDDRRVVVAIGNVKIKKMETAITADGVILWFDKAVSKEAGYKEMPLNEIYAEGNVTMRRQEDVLIAERIFNSVKEDKGMLVNSKIKTTVKRMEDIEKPFGGGVSETGKDFFEELPVYIHGEEIKQLGKGQYEIKSGVITTCGYGHPHYHFKGKKIRLIRRNEHNIVTSKNNFFYIDKYPVAYLPYLSLDVRKKERILKDWEFGSTSRFGTFLRTDWDLYAATGGKQKEWSDLTLRLDYLQERGLGTGFEFKYNRQGIAGFVDTYYIKDQGEFDINEIPIDKKDRDTVLWRHRQQLPYDWRLDMEYSQLSDPRFLREYFPHEFHEQKDHETVLYFRKIHDTTAKTFLINEQLNGFDTVVDSLRERRIAERLPELSYRIIGEPLWDNRVLLTSESSITYFDSVFDRTDQPVEAQPVGRIDSISRVSMPFKPGFFNIKPFFEGRVTGYSESIDTSGAIDEADGPARGRFIGSIGLDWSSTHWRTYSVYNDFLQLNRLRHIFVPELRYIYNPVVTLKPDKLYQYDAVDALESSQVLVLGIKNKLQTKRGEPGYERTVDFVELNIDYYVFPGKRGLFNDGINGIIIREDNFVSFDLRCQLTDKVAFISERNEFNTEEFRFDVLSSGFLISNPPDWRYLFEHRFIRDISSTIILAVDYRISEKWRVLAGEVFDLRSRVIDEDVDKEGVEKARNLSTNLVMSRYFHDWVGSLTLQLDPVRNDKSFRFDIIPRELAEGTRRFWWF